MRFYLFSVYSFTFTGEHLEFTYFISSIVGHYLISCFDQRFENDLSIGYGEIIILLFHKVCYFVIWTMFIYVLSVNSHHTAAVPEKYLKNKTDIVRLWGNKSDPQDLCMDENMIWWKHIITLDDFNIHEREKQSCSSCGLRSFKSRILSMFWARNIN